MSETSPAPIFSVETDAQEDVLHLSLVGECDLSTVEALKDALDTARKDGRRILVDLERLEFLDSTCLRTLLEAHAADPDAPPITFRRGPANVMRVFEIAGILDRFSFEN